MKIELKVPSLKLLAGAPFNVLCTLFTAAPAIRNVSLLMVGTDSDV